MKEIFSQGSLPHRPLAASLGSLCWQDLCIPNWFVLSVVTLTCFYVKPQNPCPPSPLAPVQMILATASPTNRTVPKKPPFPRLVPVLPKPGQGCFSRRMFPWRLLPSCSRVYCGSAGADVWGVQVGWKQPPPSPLHMDLYMPARLIFCSQGPQVTGLTSSLLTMCPSFSSRPC